MTNDLMMRKAQMTMNDMRSINDVRSTNDQ